MESYIAVLLILLSPLAIAVGGFWLILRLQGQHRYKSPISRKVLRYPGYTLGKTVEDLDEQLTANVMGLFIVPAIFLALYGTGNLDLDLRSTQVIVGILYLGGLAWFIMRILRVGRKLRQARLGLSGERIVGRELSELLRHGFHVFHDIPMDFGNVDHVVIGPPGIFAIETKFRRKLRDQKDGFKVWYDGRRLKFGDKETSRPLMQAKQQAQELDRLLGKMFDVGTVTPVLVYPGWWVEQEKQNVEVLVFNESALVSVLPKRPQRLDSKTVEAVAAFFAERCRDVEV